jgi:cobalamin biosynthetic protein CobC
VRSKGCGLSEWTVHGGRLRAAEAAFPDAPMPWLDLSTGINPLPWPVPGMLAAIDLSALPDPADRAGLEVAAAAMFGAPGLPITALPGSEIGLRLMATLGLQKPWRVVAPHYASHGVGLPGAEAIAAVALEDAAQAGGTILLATPNNPDGRVIAPARLLAAARILAAQGGVLVIDEAFADAVPAASVLPLLAPGDAVLVLRSFGKFFGLAGLRLGFAIGVGAEALRDRLGDWPVSSSAIAIGAAAYGDAGWIAATRLWLTAQGGAIDAVLARHGLTGSGDCPLFRLVRTPDAGTVFDRLARRGILTRPFDYAPDWLRFGLPGDAAALARLDEALRG